MANKLKNLIGQRFGKLVVIKRDMTSKSTKWICQCDCGNFTSVFSQNLLSGITKSCGCNKIKNIMGQRFSRLTVIDKEYKNGCYQWICQCDCGNFIKSYAYPLISGKTKSCGCYHKEQLLKRITTHNLSKKRIYTIYYDIKARCYNSNNSRYKDYGGRGIKVCDEWLDKDNGFMNFYNWAIENSYQENLTIDRIDVNGNYEPSNCRWATMEIQYNNKRNSILITICNKTKALKQWCNLMNWSYNKYYARYYRKRKIFNEEELKQINFKIKGGK